MEVIWAINNILEVERINFSGGNISTARQHAVGRNGKPSAPEKGRKEFLTLALFADRATMKPSSKMGLAGEQIYIFAGLSWRCCPVWSTAQMSSWGNSDDTWGFSSLSETGVPWHLLWMKVRAGIVSPFQIGAVPAWWEPAGEAVPMEGVDSGYLKVRDAGNNQQHVNIV